MLRSSSPVTFCGQFQLSVIKFATNNFSDDLIIGKGSFGNVYKAKIGTEPENRITVAVKRLNSDSKQGSHEFWTEVNLLSTYRHSHLISLIGFCVDYDDNEMLLVYEYMSNGTLADHLYKNNDKSSFLSWEQRLKICIGVARGVEYLHTGTRIDQIVIHRDLKSSNILLDADWAAKISDFGLCKTCRANRPHSPITASVKGTFAYMDPNYCTTHELSRKTDVYAFGVVLLEVFCGRRALDFEVTERQKSLVLWAQQCIREGVVNRIIDPGLRGRISNDGLQTFLDITQKCLQDRPKKRPTMVEVVAKLESALASQYTTYSSSSSSSIDDEFVKIFFGHEAHSSSSANSDDDTFRHAVENGSGKSDTVKQDPGSASTITALVKRFTRLKSSSQKNASDVSSDLQKNQINAEVSMRSTTAAASEPSISLSHDKDDEYEKLFKRMNPPKVAVDNESCQNATVIKIDSNNTQGVLSEIIQVLNDFDLIITRASRTCDGLWFMDVFNVIDQEGNKIIDEAKIENILQALHAYSSSTLSTRRDDEKYFPNDHTTIEFIGNDRPGLLSEVSAILVDFRCNVVSAEVWTHNTRTAAVMQLSDEVTGAAIIESERLSEIQKLLKIILKGGNDNREAKIAVTHGCTRFDRRLHQMMFDDRDYERGSDLTLKDKQRPDVRVVNWYDKDYSVVNIGCKDRPKLLFDTVCTLTDLMYFIFHGSVVTEGSEAYMEFCIRHVDGFTAESDAERQRVIQCLEAAIERGVSKGLKIEVCTQDRVGLLSDVTRIIRENSLTITRAEVTTTGGKAVFAFYVDDTLGYPVDPKIVDIIRNEIGQTILEVKGNHEDLYQVPQESFTRSIFSDLLKTFVG